MFIVTDSSGSVLGCASKIENVNKIEYVNLQNIPYVPTNGSITVKNDDDEIITIWHRYPVT